MAQLNITDNLLQIFCLCEYEQPWYKTRNSITGVMLETKSVITVLCPYTKLRNNNRSNHNILELHDDLMILKYIWPNLNTKFVFIL